MNTRETGYGAMLRTAPDRFHGLSNPTERPMTPLNPLVQQSTLENYRDVLDRLGGSSASAANNPPSELTHHLLPKDVNYYYLATDKVTSKVQNVFQAERKAIEYLIDEYLKQIVNIFELKKSEIFAVLEKNEIDFDDFYKKFRQQVQNFLDMSMNKLDRSMMMEQDLQQSISDGGLSDLDPLQGQLKKINIDKMRVEAKRQALDEICQDYKRSGINEHKRVIENMIVEAAPNEFEQKRTSVNKKVLAQSLDAVIMSLQREMSYVKFMNEPVRPSSKMDQMRQSGTLRVTSPMLMEKLNPHRPPLINGDNSGSKIGGLSRFGPMLPLGMTNRPLSCEPFKGQVSNFLELDREKSRGLGGPPSEMQSNDQERNPFPLKPGQGQGQTSDFGSMDSRFPKPLTESTKPKDPKDLKDPKDYKDYINIYNPPKVPPNEQALPPTHQSDMKGKSVYPPIKFNALPNLGSNLRQPSTDSRFPNPAARPTSGNAQRINGLMLGRIRQDIEPIRLVNPPVISENKTHLMTKTNLLPTRFNTKLLINDHSSKFNCFELDTVNSLVIFGTVEEKLVISEMDVKKMGLVNTREVDLSLRSFSTTNRNGATPDLAKSPSQTADPNVPKGVTNIIQQKPGVVLVSSNGPTNSNVFLVDTVKGTIVNQYKTQQPIIRQLCIMDHEYFLAIVEDDKMNLYRFDATHPRRIFKIPTTRIADVCVIPFSSILTGSETGDIRIIKYTSNGATKDEKESLVIEGSMNINVRIRALDTFHNNKKILIAYTQSADKDQIHILNIVEKKSLIVIENPRPARELFGYTMLTLHGGQQGQAYLLAFGDNQVKQWDIDKKDAGTLLVSENEESFHMKTQPFGRGKPVKMLGLNSKGQIVAVGLCTVGIMSFTLV